MVIAFRRFHHWKIQLLVSFFFRNATNCYQQAQTFAKMKEHHILKPKHFTMKKYFFKMAALLLVLHVAGALHAQTKTISSIDRIPGEALATTSEHSAKVIAGSRVVSKFEKAFPGATDASWMNTNDGFAVRFLQKGIQHMAFMTKRGNCISYIRYYFEKDLPPAVRTLVKSTYFDYKITSAEEVYHNNVTAYLVTIEDETTWKIIRVVDDEMDVYASFKKG